ncbi:hypothetical protein [Anabaena lutea]|uniref:Uncharacterized protein n=1 Tax=Anabaena lutea FACHB-196 TaxID=2692881 RepID=A0ABR8FFS8_9NOST|nr:hypothetical protein [Anabaena lutea]MBD2568596.1 hypothetical protein [Anabaena lutea FACHB-196]
MMTTNIKTAMIAEQYPFAQELITDIGQINTKKYLKHLIQLGFAKIASKI